MFFIFLFVALLMFGLPRYNVWQQEMAGKAEMAKAEQNRRILVEEAKAKLEAEKLNAQAEIERAKGMAEATIAVFFKKLLLLRLVLTFSGRNFFIMFFLINK